jgi:hypothetical protein
MAVNFMVGRRNAGEIGGSSGTMAKAAGYLLVLFLVLSALLAIAAPVAAENHTPSIDITEPDGGGAVSGVVTVWMAASDQDGVEEIQEVWVRLDGGELHNATYNHTDPDGQWWYYEWDTTTVEDGWHHIKAVTFDGQADAHDIIEVLVDNVAGNNPPGVDIIHPHDGKTVSGVYTVWVVAWDLDGSEQVEDVWVKFDEGELLNATYNHTNGEGQWWYYEWDTTAVEDGWHHIKAFASDGEAEVHDLIEVKVDNIPDNNPPGVDITHPPAGKPVEDVVTIWMVAWDLDGSEQVQDVWVRFGEGELLNATYNHTNGEGQWWYYEWNTTEFEEGWHHIKAVAFDGEDDCHDVIEVKVDNIPDNPPHVEIVEPEQGDNVSGIVNVSMKTWDADGNEDVESLFVKMDDGEWQEAVLIEHGDEFSWWYLEGDSTTVENGEHHIHAKAWDGQEHSEMDTVGVHVVNPPPNSPPVVEIAEPAQDENVSGTVDITIHAQDPDGNDDIEMVFVRIDDGDWSNATFVEALEGYSLWTFEWDTTDVENDEYQIQARAWDGQRSL